jgi:hypothetical protein
MSGGEGGIEEEMSTSKRQAGESEKKNVGKGKGKEKVSESVSIFLPCTQGGIIS